MVKELIEGWNNDVISGFGSFILMEIIKFLKTKHKSWNGEVFRRVEERKKAALKWIAQYDEMDTHRILIACELEDKVKAIDEFKRWAMLEEILWRQKSREI